MLVNLFNSQNPNGKRVPVSVNIVHEDNVVSNDGELLYLMTFSTGALDILGQRIPAIVFENITAPSIQDYIEQGLTQIASQIDWELLEDDTFAPTVTQVVPSPNQEDIKIYSNVLVKVVDRFPTAGLDFSSLTFTVNDIDVTPEVNIKGNETQALITWVPKKITD